MYYILYVIYFILSLQFQILYATSIWDFNRFSLYLHPNETNTSNTNSSLIFIVAIRRVVDAYVSLTYSVVRFLVCSLPDGVDLFVQMNTQDIDFFVSTCDIIILIWAMCGGDSH